MAAGMALAAAPPALPREPRQVLGPFCPGCGVGDHCWHEDACTYRLGNRHWRPEFALPGGWAPPWERPRPR